VEIVNINPNEAEIKEAEKNKAERKIQLNSAASNFTKKFKDWWKQGNYTFMFNADGDFFEIWVSDELRAEPVELHQRSTSLQWFFSFFLVFLVESKEAHKGTILLLDEAGLTLHPLAQKDLVGFFENLAKDNQIIHTTHSPFLIDTNNIDRVKVVYIDDDGYTVSSNNLREGITPANKNSIYAAHAALGLSVSDVLLNGCQPVIVEGTSDQYFLYAIKQYLIQNKKIAPDKELVFLPAGGTSTKGVQGIVGILGAKSEELPPILLDSDNNGESLKKTLLSGLYTGDLKKRIISAKDITGMEHSEVEDLIPFELMQKEIERAST
jgi:predicted ATPase